MTFKKSKVLSKEKRARVEKEKQPSRRYEESLFLDSECSEEFQSNFSEKKIVGGRIVDLNSFSDFRIKFLFERIGWLSMITLNKLTYPTLVHYFYSNINFNSKSYSISSLVKG